MARKAKVDTDTLISLVDQYYAEKCEGDVTQLRIPLIGQYIRSQGYDIADYILRRNEEVKEYIQKFHNSTEEAHIHTVAIYRDVDLDAFLARNNTKEKLKQSLKERENYYREVTHSAAYSFKENARLTAQIRKLQEHIKQLEEEIKVVQSDTKESMAECKKYQSENRKLRNIIETYVYPEVANELLKKDGLLHDTAEIVNPNKIEQEIVASDTDITQIRNNVIKGLFDNI